MTLEQFLQSVRPGLTLYGVLLTFSFFAFLAGRFFWQYERRLREENIEQLRALLSGFRDQHLRPVLKGQLTTAINAAYERAIEDIRADVYTEQAAEKGKVEHVLAGQDQLNQVLDEKALSERLTRLKSEDGFVEQFLDSKSGTQFFEHLDSLYGKAETIAETYRSACSACIRTAYACLGLMVVLLLGLTQIVATWPDVLWCMWALLAAEVFVYSLCSFAKMESHTRRLRRRWEELQLHGSA